MAAIAIAPEGDLYSIFDQVSDAVFVLDTEGACIYRNSQMELFPPKLLKRLVGLYPRNFSTQKDQFLQVEDWQIAISARQDYQIFICKYVSSLDQRLIEMRDEFTAALADGKSAQMSAMQALRGQVSYRWIAIGRLDFENKKIRFDLCYNNEGLEQGILAPLAPKPSFCPCSGMINCVDLSEMFQDVGPFQQLGMTHMLGLSLKNHHGDCVGYALLGNECTPADIKEASVFLESLSEIYGPYFEANSARQEADKAQRDSLTDVVTGQGNRRACETKMNELLDQYHQEQLDDPVLNMFDPSSLRNSLIMLIDLDGFKRLNDVHGHDEGDRALRLVGHLLRQSGGPDDSVYRLGGDEFVQVFPRAGHLESDNLRIRVNKIEKEMHRAGFDGLGISIGVVHFFEGDGTYSALLALADARMYHDKKMRTVFLG